MILIENLTKKYEDKEVLNISQLSIKKGEKFGLVGNNGAGKTTFLKKKISFDSEKCWHPIKTLVTYTKHFRALLRSHY